MLGIKEETAKETEEAEGAGEGGEDGEHHKGIGANGSAKDRVATEGHNAVATKHGSGTGRRRKGAVTKCIHTWLKRGQDIMPRSGGGGGEVKRAAVDGGLTSCEGKTMGVKAEVAHRWW